MKRYAILTLMTLFLWTALHSEESFFRNISWAGQHSNATVRTFFRDSDGYCWMGIDNQLVRFDGSHLIDLPVDLDERGQDYVRAIGEIKGQFMLAGTESGLWRVPDMEGALRFERLFENEISSVRSINTIDSISVALGTSSGMHIYSWPSQKLRTILFKSSRLSSANNVLASTVYKRKIYVVTAGGIFRIDMASWGVTPLMTDRPVTDATCLAYSGGRLFVGSSTSGLGVYEASTGKYIGSVDTGCNVVTSVSTSPSGDVWVGTDGNGVLCIDALTLVVKRHLEKRTSKGGVLSSSQVYAVLSCSHDELWVGYYQSAADYSLHTGKKFRVYEIPDIFDSHGITVRTLSLSDDGIMIGTREGLIYLPSDGSTPRRISSPRLRSDMVLAICRVGRQYYIGTYGGGCMVYDPADDSVSDLITDSDTPFRKGHIFAIASDAEGVLWFGTSEGLIAWKDGKVIHKFNSSNSKLPGDNVFTVFFDSSGKGWAGADRGLVIISPQRAEIHTELFPKGFVDGRSIRHIYEDSDHMLYLVSEKGPLTVTNLDMTDFHDVDPGLFHNAEVRSVIEDNEGQMWVTTSNGLFRWDKGQVAKRFGFADGIVNSAFISGNPVKDSDGVIWTGNPDGLICFAPQQINEPADNNPISVTGILADDRIVSPLFLSADKSATYSLELASKPHIVRIDFSDFLYSQPETSNYEYSLDGDTWKKTTSEMSAMIYDLKFGRNTIIIRSTQNKGNKTKVEIIVPYPMWYWIILGGAGAIAVALVVWLLFKRRHGADMDDPVSYPAQEYTSDVETETMASVEKRKKYGANKVLTDAEIMDIERNLSEVMSAGRPYLNKDLSISDLATALGLSSHRLSQYFSQHLNVTFYDFINRARVEEFKRIAGAEEMARFTLTGLSEKAGFSSRASFFRNFKKFEGITPAEYLKNLQQ